MYNNFNNWQLAYLINNDYNFKPTYFIESLAEANILGVISDDELEKELYTFYQGNTDLFEYRISLFIIRTKKALSSNEFDLSIDYFFKLHEYLFDNLYDDAGQKRDYSISRREKCLDLRSVYYSAPDLIMDNLEYDFTRELKKDYSKMNDDQLITNLASFISNIWQAHPFSDGNTRCTAVFMQKYLNSLNINYNHNVFKENFEYFRNALVRSNPTTYAGLRMTNEYIENFLKKLIFNKDIELSIEDTYLSRKYF